METSNTEEATQPDNKKRTFNRRRFLKYTAATATGTALWYDSAHTGANITPEQLGQPQPEDTSSLLTQLVDHPTSRDALTVFPMLTYSRTKNGTAEFASLAHGAVGPYLEYNTNEKATNTYIALSGQFTDKAPLYDVSILEPSVARQNNSAEASSKAKNQVNLRMIAHHSSPDPTSGFEAAAYYNDTAKTLIITFAGVAMDINALRPVLQTMRDKPQAQLERVDNFMHDLEHQIKVRGLKVHKSVIFGHSIGGEGAVGAVAHLAEHPEFAKRIGGIPKTVLLEDWMGKQFSDACVARSKMLKVEDISRHCISVRHFPASFTGQKENPPLGRAVAIIHNREAQNFLKHLKQLVTRQMNHTCKPTITDLFQGNADIYPDFKGEFVSTHLMSDAFKPYLYSCADHPYLTGAGTTAAVGTFVFKEPIKRKIANIIEKHKQSGLQASNNEAQR